MPKFKINEEEMAKMREKIMKSQLRRLRVVTAKLVSRLSAYDIGMPQVIVLLELCFGNDCEPAQIADRTLIPRQTMTTILDKLEKLRLVERVDHPTDRRRKVIELTKDGYDKAVGIWKDLDAYEEKVMSVLSKEEVKLLDALDEKIGARLKELD